MLRRMEFGVRCHIVYKTAVIIINEISDNMQ